VNPIISRVLSHCLFGGAMAWLVTSLINAGPD